MINAQQAASLSALVREHGEVEVDPNEQPNTGALAVRFSVSGDEETSHWSEWTIDKDGEATFFPEGIPGHKFGPEAESQPESKAERVAASEPSDADDEEAAA